MPGRDTSYELAEESHYFNRGYIPTQEFVTVLMKSQWQMTPEVTGA